MKNGKMEECKKENYWQEYGLCVLFHMLFPFIPLVLEMWISSELSAKSLLLSTAIYAISIGNGSCHRLMLGCCILVSFVFSAMFGVVVAIEVNKIQVAAPPNIETSAYITLILLFLTSMVEKHSTHVLGRNLYWNH